MAKDPKPSLVELVAKATEADLASIDEQITAKEAELADATRRIGGELDALKALRKVVDVKLHGKPQRKPRQAKAASHKSNGEPNGFRSGPPAPSRVAVHSDTTLASEIIGAINLHGPLLPDTLARKLDRSPVGIKMAVGKSDHLKLLSDGRVALANHDESDD